MPPLLLLPGFAHSRIAVSQGAGWFARARATRAKLIPQKGDTPESLLARVGRCGWLDWINVFNTLHKWRAKCGGLANLNTCPESHQPKRRSESVVVTKKEKIKAGEGSGRWAWRLFNYTSFARCGAARMRAPHTHTHMHTLHVQAPATPRVCTGTMTTGAGDRCSGARLPSASCSG